MVNKKNDLGFTLVEIITVLLIIGILSAIAIPRYISLQENARISVLNGAFAAGASVLALDFAQTVFSGVDPLVWDVKPDEENVILGDFTATISFGCGDNASRVTITSGPPGWDNLPSGTDTHRDFSICN